MTLHDLFEQALHYHASDLHIVVDRKPILRIDGVLHEIDDAEVITQEIAQQLIFGILSQQDRERFIAEKELDLGYDAGNKIRFRVNLHWERGRMGLVARLIPSVMPTLEDVLMPDSIKLMLDRKQGLILVTGPTGCGKSTSLAAMIHYINETRSEHIVTLEDPIEFVYESQRSIIKQRQLGQDMLSFTEGLKHVLRQDPNVILVGEMRDLETVATTITLAETGHLVLATLHTFNAAQTVDRIVDIFPPHQQDQVRLQLSLFLTGIISQQLVPRVSKGRIASREILINSPAVANLIRENKIQQIRSVLQTSLDEGMMTMDQDLRRLYEAGEISDTTARAYMTSPESLETMMKNEVEV